jgi:hypothetical protein
MAVEQARIVEEEKKDESDVNVDRMEVEKTQGKVKKRHYRKRLRKEVKVRWIKSLLAALPPSRAYLKMFDRQSFRWLPNYPLARKEQS